MSKLAGSYETVLYSNGSSNSLISFAPVALKEEGLCHTTRVPAEVVRAGVSEVSVFFYADPAHNMKVGTDFSVRGWTAVLHHEGQMRRSNSVR